MLLSEQAYQRIDRELTKYPPDQKRSAVMAALAIAQQEKGWLSTDVIRDVADYLELPAIAVQEVATFYDMFNTSPVGRYKITVCRSEEHTSELQSRENLVCRRLLEKKKAVALRAPE